MWFLDGITSTNKYQNDYDKIKDDDTPNVSEAEFDDSAEDINNSSNHTGTCFFITQRRHLNP